MVKGSERLCNVVYATTDNAIPNEIEMLDIFCESIYSILNKTAEEELVA